MRAFLVLVTMVASSNVLAEEWKQLASLPDKEGFAGMYAGVSNGALLVAGGANFPDKKPWEGGKKVWYDTVFVLEKPNGDWKTAGKLPRPLGTGVSVTHGGSVVCVGGGDLNQHYADAFRLDWRDGKLVSAALPSLPKANANACGALVGDVLYIAGGLEKPDASNTMKIFWKIDLSAAEPTWQELEPWPGSGRMLAVAAGFDGAFWLVGGTDLVPGKDGKAERHYLKDAYRYDAGQDWAQIADLPHSVVAAPSPAPADAAGFYILGGDDGSQIDVEPNKHRGFNSSILQYNSKSKTWRDAGKVFAPRAVAPCVLFNKSWVVPNGEARPGVRSPEVWSWTVGNAK